MVVVLGNAIMYEVCGRVSDYIGFKTRDHRAACYLILYVVTCCFNVALDMATTYFTSMQILQGLDFRTYYGVKLADIPSFTQQFILYVVTCCFNVALDMFTTYFMYLLILQGLDFRIHYGVNLCERSPG